VAIDAVDDAAILVVHALVHRTEAGVAQRAVHRVTVIVCAVVAEAAGVADGDGAAGTLIAFAAQLVILADVALAAGRAVRFLHAVGALVALVAPKGRIEQTLTTIVAVEFSEAVGVAVNSAEPATVAAILSPVVVVAVFAILALVVVFPKGAGMKLHARQQREQHHHAQQPRQEPLSTRRTPRGRSVHFFHEENSSWKKCTLLRDFVFSFVIFLLFRLLRNHEKNCFSRRREWGTA